MKNKLFKKVLVLSVIYLFIGASVVPNIIADEPVDGITIYVDDDASIEWYDATHVKTIQEGIDNATVDETIYVFNGTYYENLIINKTVNLIGENKNTTIIDGNGSGDVINITANWVNITNFGIRNKDYLSYPDYKHGIKIYASSNNKISNCNIYNNSYGIYQVSFSNNNTITNNIIYNNIRGFLIYSNHSKNTIISYNTFNNNRYVIYHDSVKKSPSSSIYIGDPGNHNTTIIGNILINNLSYPYLSGITFSYSSNNTISDNTITNYSYSIRLWYSSNNTISDNNFVKGYIEIYYSNNNNILKNTFSNYSYSIRLISSNNNIILDNLVIKGIIYLYDFCDNNIITRNTISNNDNTYGISIIDSSSNNTITSNNISNNFYGVYIAYSSYNNTVSGNNISNNSYSGIYIGYSSHHNNILDNSFFNDGLQVWDSYKNNVSNNTINDKPLIYLEDESDIVINGDAGQVILVNCDNITIQNQEISNTNVGVELWASNNSIISGNTLSSNNQRGLYLQGYCINNYIMGNNLLHNFFGAYIDKSSFNTIAGNNISNNNYGIYSARSNNNIITNNSISNNGYGIRLYSSQYSGAPCSNNIFYKNHIFNNTDYGVYLTKYSSENWILQNNFIDNNNGNVQAYDADTNNHWDNDNLGNYWSDYLNRYPSAININGVWNMSYSIDGGAGAADHYPLVSPVVIGEELPYSYLIYPNFGYNLTTNYLVNLYGFGFVEGVTVRLTKEGDEDIVGENIIVLSDKHITTKFNLSNKTVGIWNVTVIFPNGHQSYLPEAFQIREQTGFIPDIFIKAGDTLSYNIVVPETDNLFITLQKTTLTSYGNSWYGKLSIHHNGVEIKSDSGSHDLILHLKDPTPGEYTIKITASQGGSGILNVQTTLPELPLGEWVVDTIYCSYGSTWFQVEVPPDQDALYLEAEGVGLWSIIDIYYDQYGSNDRWMSPMAYDDLQTSIEILNPTPGTYIVEFMDSAMIFNGNNWSEDQTREILIKADTTSSFEPPPDYLPVITSFSPERGGNTGFVTVEINGGWLDENATVSLIRSGFVDILADYIRKDSSSSTLYATFNLIDQEPGEWTLVVTNPNGRNATAPIPFIIEEGGEPELWMEIIGREKIRIDREATYEIIIGNSGNVDSHFAYAILYAPFENYQINLPFGYTPIYDDEKMIFSDFTIEIPTITAHSMIKIPISISIESFKTYDFKSEIFSLTDIISPESDLTSRFISSNNNEDDLDQYPPLWNYNEKGNPPPLYEIMWYDKEGYYGYTHVATSLGDGEFIHDFKDENVIIKNLNTVNEPTYIIRPPDWSEEKALIWAAEIKQKYYNGDFSDEKYYYHSDSEKGMNCDEFVRDIYPKLNLLRRYLPILPQIYAPGELIDQLWNYWWEKDYYMPIFTWKTDLMFRIYQLSDLWRDFLKMINMFISGVFSLTPEDKFGPNGYNNLNTPINESKRFIKEERNLYYSIDFWNKENATAPACDVYVNDQLDANLNWSTFRFEEIGFLNWTVKLEQPCQYFNVYVDTCPEMDLIVNIEGIFNPQTGAINWTFKSLDPITLETPDDPMAGFLPPINESGYEVGWVCFSVDTESGLKTGTQIKNQAFVNFDGVGPFNPAPKEGPFTNTIDAYPPMSNMTATLLDEYHIQLNWSGNDDLNGSGIRDYTIYVSIDNDTYIPYISNSENVSAVFNGEQGHLYSFYSIARDNVGHLEDKPVMADVIISTLNTPPIAVINESYNGFEGSSVNFNGSMSSDPDDDILQYRWDFDNDSEWDTEYSTIASANYTWNDDYSGTVVLEVYDGVFIDINTTTVIINNVAPNITSLTLPTNPIAVNASKQLTANFTDPGSSDTHNATIKWDDGNTSFIDISEGNYTVNCSYKYQEAGVYTINLTVEDDDGGSDIMIFRYVVVYDPSGGFVTGGGWIDSPEGAYTLDPNITGKANFGFVSKYKKGQQNPIGNTEFQFKAADMNFHSDSYEWLVIGGAKAMYKGTGTINGSGNYGFMLFAIDEDLTPSTDVDLFRIKIWDKDNDDEVIYDNELGEEEDADPTTQIDGGQIKIHKQ